MSVLDTLKNTLSKTWSTVKTGFPTFLEGLGTIGSVAASAKGLFGSSGGTSVYKTGKIMKMQNNYQKDFANWYLNNITSHQYRAERRSLEEAGYNPMLAYMNGSSGVPSGATNATAVSGNDAIAGADLYNAIANARLTNAQVAKIEAETENIGNKPSNIIINAVKGLTGNPNISGSKFASYLGSSLRSKSIGFRNKLMSKLNSYGLLLSDRASDVGSGVLHGYVTNVNSNPLNLKIPKFTEEEYRIIDEAVRNSKIRKSDTIPPKTFPI